jgi:hypothetical protein
MANNPKRQVQHLRAILLDLGMSGRPSLTEARKIKERRELLDDVSESTDVSSDRDYSLDANVHVKARSRHLRDEFFQPATPRKLKSPTRRRHRTLQLIQARKSPSQDRRT